MARSVILFVRGIYAFACVFASIAAPPFAFVGRVGDEDMSPGIPAAAAALVPASIALGLPDYYVVHRDDF